MEEEYEEEIEETNEEEYKVTWWTYVRLVLYVLLSVAQGWMLYEKWFSLKSLFFLLLFVISAISIVWQIWHSRTNQV